MDLLTDDYPFLSAYQYASNDLISNIDIDGLEGLNIIHSTGYMVNGVAFGVQGAEYTVIASKMTGSVLGVASSIGSLAGSAASIAGNISVQSGHFSFWNTDFGRVINDAANWFNQNLNPVYLGFNGINSQFTGKDFLRGAPVSWKEGAAQLLETVPIGKVANLGKAGVETIGTVIAKNAAKTSTKSLKQTYSELVEQATQKYGGNVTVQREGVDLFRVHQTSSGHEFTITQFKNNVTPSGKLFKNPIDVNVRKTHLKQLERALKGDSRYNIRTRGGQ